MKLYVPTLAHFTVVGHQVANEEFPSERDVSSLARLDDRLDKLPNVLRVVPRPASRET